MSIIYDALEKTQQTRGKQGEQNEPLPRQNRPRFKFNWRYLRLAGMGAIVLLSMAMLLAGVPRMITFFVSLKQLAVHDRRPAAPPKPVLLEAKFRGSHHLNGIFLSPAERVAMIDSNLFREGDVVDGMVIASINQEGVTLKNANEKFMLASSA